MAARCTHHNHHKNLTSHPPSHPPSLDNNNMIDANEQLDPTTGTSIAGVDTNNANERASIDNEQHNLTTSHHINKTKPIIANTEADTIDFTNSATDDASMGDSESGNSSVEKKHMSLKLMVSTVHEFVFIYFKTILIDITMHVVHDAPLGENKSSVNLRAQLPKSIQKFWRRLVSTYIPFNFHF